MKKRKCYRWTEREIEYLKEYYPTTTAREVGKALYRTEDAVRVKAKALGIRSERKVFNNHGRFKKGNVPWNLGLKGVNGTSSTQWKKGHKTWNKRPIGDVWERDEKGYKCKFIKTERGIERLSHYNYRMHTGKEVPKSHVIRFKDGDSLNCDIDNLLCISRAENAMMNYNRESASKTMLIKSAGGYINALLMGKI